MSGGARNAREVLHSSESQEWYTPRPYIEAVREVIGGIDLDPASCHLANETVQARRYYTATDDGLRLPWTGRVFLNPPYGHRDGESNQSLWSRKLIDEYRTGRVTEGILLVNATPEARWFRRLWDFPLCFTDHRIRFAKPDGRANSPTHGNAFVYFGPHPDRFAAAFERFGQIVLPAGQVERTAGNRSRAPP